MTPGRLYLVEGREYDVTAGLAVCRGFVFDRDRLRFSRAGVHITIEEVSLIRERNLANFEAVKAYRWFEPDDCYLAPRARRPGDWRKIGPPPVKAFVPPPKDALDRLSKTARRTREILDRADGELTTAEVSERLGLSGSVGARALRELERVELACCRGEPRPGFRSALVRLWRRPELEPDDRWLERIRPLERAG